MLEMSNQIFQNLSYEVQKQHWLEDGSTPERLQINASWFRDDTIVFWRHRQMYEPEVDRLAESKK